MITDPDLFEFSTGRVEVLATGEDVGRTLFVPDDSGPHRIVSDLDEDRVPALISERMLAAAREARA
jgi:hypothetical protein